MLRCVSRRQSSRNRARSVEDHSCRRSTATKRNAWDMVPYCETTSVTYASCAGNTSTGSPFEITRSNGPGPGHVGRCVVRLVAPMESIGRSHAPRPSRAIHQLGHEYVTPSMPSRATAAKLKPPNVSSPLQSGETVAGERTDITGGGLAMIPSNVQGVTLCARAKASASVQWAASVGEVAKVSDACTEPEDVLVIRAA